MADNNDQELSYGTGKLSPHARALMKAMGGSAQTIAPNSAKFWGIDQPTSLINLVDDKELIEAATRLPISTFSLPEAELEKLCEAGSPTRQDRRMRIAFWEEYEKAASKLTGPMDLVNMVNGTGVLHWEAYKNSLLLDPNFLAWFLTPPASYKVQMKEAQELGLSRLIEIMSLPIQDPGTGKVRADVGALILQAYKLVDLRNQGAVAQKMVQITADAGKIPDDSHIDPDLLDQRLKELEAQLKGDQPALTHSKPEPKEVVAELEHKQPSSE